MVVEALQSSPNWPVLMQRKSTAAVATSVTPMTTVPSETAAAMAEHQESLGAKHTAAKSAAMEDAESTQPAAPSAASASPSSSSDSDAAAAPSSDSNSAPPLDDHSLIKCLLQSIVLSGRSTTLRGFGAIERDSQSDRDASDLRADSGSQLRLLDPITRIDRRATLIRAHSALSVIAKSASPSATPPHSRVNSSPFTLVRLSRRSLERPMSSRSAAPSSSGGQLHTFLLDDDAADPEVAPPKSACCAPLVRAQLRWERVKKRPGVMLALEIADWTAFFLKLAWAIYVSLKVTGYYRELERVQDDLTSATQTATQIQSQVLQLNSSVAIAEAAFTSELRSLDTGLQVLDGGLQLLNAEVNAAINTSLINQIKEAQADYRLLSNATAALASDITNARFTLGQLVNTTRIDAAGLQTQVQVDEQLFNATYTAYRSRTDASALALAASVIDEQHAFNRTFVSFESQLAAAVAAVISGSGIAVFSTVGSFNWSVPVGVTSVWLTACGGGGGGNTFGGGGGAASIRKPVLLQPSDSVISVTVGNAGIGSGGTGSGLAGTASSFGSYAAWGGGGGGSTTAGGLSGGPGASSGIYLLGGFSLLGAPGTQGASQPPSGFGAGGVVAQGGDGFVQIEWI